jgi:hypothetical protein
MAPERDDDPEGDEKGGIPDALRKALVSGLSAVLMTEEGIRGALADMRLPKDAMSYLVQQTASSRRELVRLITDEAKSLVKNVDLQGEIRKALNGMKLEVKAEIRFVDENAAKAKESANDEADEPEREGPAKRRRRP